jgi:hypothetical protein
MFEMHWGVSRKPPFCDTDKTLLLKYYLVLKSNSVSLHEGERVVFAC